ncbi:MAG TPA: hypothetical protein VHA73_02335 [Acidimicrobiales bacterium]|jgi:hypothetical protein|nr:hypothetical protein [Acidimicrobiales bacterium]
MHPIERMRYVARATGAEHGLLAREAAGALASFASEPTGLVTACRRMVERHPTNGALWWLAARVLLADHPGREAFDAADALDADTTAGALARALPDDAVVAVLGWPELVADALPLRGDVRPLVVDAGGHGSSLVMRLRRADVDAGDVAIEGLGGAVADADIVLLEGSAVGPSSFVGAAGSLAAAAVARQTETEVWLVAGVGRWLPGSMFDALAARLDLQGEPWDRDEEVVPLALVDRVVGPGGAETVDAARLRTDCPVVPELLRPA